MLDRPFTTFNRNMFGELTCSPPPQNPCGQYLFSSQNHPWSAWNGLTPPQTGNVNCNCIWPQNQQNYPLPQLPSVIFTFQPQPQQCFQIPPQCQAPPPNYQTNSFLNQLELLKFQQMRMQQMENRTYGKIMQQQLYDTYRNNTNPFQLKFSLEGGNYVQKSTETDPSTADDEKTDKAEIQRKDSSIQVNLGCNNCAKTKEESSEMTTDDEDHSESEDSSKTKINNNTKKKKINK